MDHPSSTSISDGAGVRTEFCYMCGSGSCDKSLLACKMCNCCIHIYCYISFCTGASKDIDPDEWVCEYCQPPNFTCSSKPAASKFTTGSVKFERPVRCIPENEVIALRAGSTTPKGRGPPTPPEKPFMKDNIKGKGICETSRKTRGFRVSNQGRGPPTPPEKPFMKDNIKGKGICETSRKTCGFRVSNQGTEKNTEDNLHSPSSINPLEPALDVLTSSPIPASSSGQDHNIEQHVHVDVPFSLAEPSPELQSCKEHTEGAFGSLTWKRKELGKRKERKGVDLCTNQLKTSTNPVEQSLEDAQVRIDGCLPNPPFQHAAWKGSFTITASGFGASADSCDNIWGYLPMKTSMKALEFSKQMPNFLHFDVVRRDIIWANMFAEGGPDKDDIGLYFLPPVIRSEQSCFCLVSLLEKLDAVIRCHINGVQLLVFTSKHLDDKSQKINGAYYLWGLFVSPDAAFKEPPQVRGKRAMEDTALHIAESQQILSVQVKAEQLNEDDLAPPPGFAPRPLLAVPPEPELPAPPGFARVRPRVKLRSIGDLLRNSD